MQNLGISNLSILCREVGFLFKEIWWSWQIYVNIFWQSLPSLGRQGARHFVCWEDLTKESKIFSGNTPDQLCRVNKTLLDLLFFFFFIHKYKDVLHLVHWWGVFWITGSHCLVSLYRFNLTETAGPQSHSLPQTQSRDADLPHLCSLRSRHRGQVCWKTVKRAAPTSLSHLQRKPG